MAEIRCLTLPHNKAMRNISAYIGSRVPDVKCPHVWRALLWRHLASLKRSILLIAHISVLVLVYFDSLINFRTIREPVTNSATRNPMRSQNLQDLPLHSELTGMEVILSEQREFALIQPTTATLKKIHTINNTIATAPSTIISIKIFAGKAKKNITNLIGSNINFSNSTLLASLQNARLIDVKRVRHGTSNPKTILS